MITWLLLLDHNKTTRILIAGHTVGSCKLHELKGAVTCFPEAQLRDTQLIDTRQWDI